MGYFSDLDTIAPKELWEGVLGWSVDSEHVTVGVIELAPGACVPEHRHDNEQLGVLITGSLDFRIGQESKLVEPGAIWRIPSGVPHTVSAGEQGAVAIEVFSPVRDDWRSLPTREPGRGSWP